jgi:hypothetical protein
MNVSQIDDTQREYYYNGIKKQYNVDDEQLNMVFDDIMKDVESIVDFKTYIKSYASHLMKNKGYTPQKIKDMLENGTFNKIYDTYVINEKKNILLKYGFK